MSTSLCEFYDAHGDAPDELPHGQQRGHGLIAVGPSQVQRSPSASQGYGGARTGRSCSELQRPRSPRPAGWRSWQATPSPGTDARAGASSSLAGPAHPSVA
jgi:hypothetical protein